MSEPTPLTATEIHAYDQAHANSEHALATLINTYIDLAIGDHALDVPAAVTNVMFAKWLNDTFPADALASVLCIAVVALGRKYIADEMIGEEGELA